MPKFVVDGGLSLNGEIRPAGNKNAALPMIAAALLTEEPVVYDNVPEIRDVKTLLDLMGTLGVQAEWIGPNRLRVQAVEVSASELQPGMAARIRASILLAGPMLARVGQMKLPPPGGDVIGRRRVDTHFLALAGLGAHVETTGGYAIRTDGLIGARVFLDEPSVTATENAVMAASMAKGHTRLENAAAEPHVQDLCNMLVGMGAQISGIGTGVLEIDGVDRLKGGDFRITSDHIEVGSFIGLAAVTRGEILIKDAALQHLNSTLIAFERMGIRCQPQGDDLLVAAEQEMRVRMDVGGHVPKVDDGPWPAFPADLTSIALVVATQCHGTILIHEKMFESRMFFADKIIGMGARIVLCDPHRAVVIGPSRLHASVMESPDIRAGMGLLIAALGAEGESHIYNIAQIERGYEKIDDRLRALGARIERHDSREDDGR
ncbi:MAG TPA: UDP-N-acetylglucosamine 1-carboxyvinyltransferase [Longimicrobiales bacterium]|nr:UDP-N-acetylglucosamine 1-carboxyvinyltransferase [Longimicrobiales bacterium]